MDNPNILPQIPRIFNTNPKFDLKLVDHTPRALTSSTANNNHNTNVKNHIKVPPIPSVVGIGPEKCGTTSMSYMLSRHPDKIPELMKPVHEPTGVDCEMRVWLPCGNRDFKQTLANVLYDGVPDKGRNFCSLGWYSHFWTPNHDDIRFLDYYLQHMNSSQTPMDLLQNIAKTEYKSENPLSWKWKYYYYFEKSPAYWCYEHVAYLFHKLLVPQGTKFFVLMRDPIKRSFSYWSHQTQIHHLKGKWPQYIQSSLDNQHMKSMIALMRDESKTILEIKDNLLKLWSDYVYSEKYGYIGRRLDAPEKKTRKNPRLSQKFSRRKILDVKHTNDLRQDIVQEWKHKQGYDDSEMMANTSTRRRLWSQRDPGFVGADTNPRLGIGASCYVIPLLMWLEYVPVTQMSVMQSELMYGGNHNNFISDVRCWYSLDYEYDTMEECRKDGKKNVFVQEEHMTSSSKSKVSDNDAQTLYDGIFKYCNKRLKELLDMQQFKSMMLHQISWDAWYGS